MRSDRGSAHAPLMVGIGGIGAEIASMLLPERGIDVLLLDTDRRTLENLPIENSVLVGEQVVKGEGTGGNLNTAKACFKLSMDEIAPRVLGRPLVVTVASATGSTGAAGSVEVVQFLSKVGLPTFSVLVHEPSVPEEGPGHMAEVLLDGPLRPASLVNTRKLAKEELAHFLGNILEGSREENQFPVPVSAWGLLRESGGPYRLVHLADISRDTGTTFDPPGVIVLRMPKGQTVEGSRELIGRILKEPEGMGVGMVLSGEEDRVSVFAVVSRRPPHQPVPGPRLDPERTREAIGSELGSGMDMIRDAEQEIH